ncbi:MAG: DUF4445 domain-containing protein [Armatimonadetes bacterium]|nr:DUF4445 domain-containing protein [Armatimonadota bacterium]MDE2206585.1 DUF4445 domain-containing protein [Armatimonadota bacterium]
MPQITLSPTATRLNAAQGQPLRDILFEHGVEFPCGGQGRCRGCRVRIRSGSGTPNGVELDRLTPQELADGWRLACQCRVETDMEVELRQWDAAVLTDDTAFRFTAQEGAGIAIDLGTTTLVAQLLDLETGRVLAVRTALNQQARYGADIMSRIQFAMSDGGQLLLESAIRGQLGGLVRQLCQAAGVELGRLRRITLVGNTVMHHLFCGISVEPLSMVPFEAQHAGLQTICAAALDWCLAECAVVQFLPCLGGFVGSDLLAGILATQLHTRREPSVLIDLGTNGEILVGNRDRILCTSTAAGPAFEGARIAMGMRAASGAIWKVGVDGGVMTCEVLGDGEPRGLCGSGLVDAAAAGLDIGVINPSGRLDGGRDIALAGPVSLTQADIRQLQMAKGAIAAGLRILLRMFGAETAQIEHVFLAGAFGNYVDRASARRIGLLNFPLDVIEPVGNTALLGAKVALCSGSDSDASYPDICRLAEHVPLHAAVDFQETFVDQMGFPTQSCPEPIAVGAAAGHSG